MIPDKFEDIETDEPRLILPFLDKDKNLFGFQGRSFKKDGIRYITIILNEDQPKIFGIDTMDPSKDIYVVEGPIDSLFLPNSLAMIGLNTDKKLPKNIKKFVYVLDNEPRNKEVLNYYDSVIQNGQSVVIWPDFIKKKDINDMIIDDINITEILNIINNNTFQNMEAKIRFIKWKKI